MLSVCFSAQLLFYKQGDTTAQRRTPLAYRIFQQGSDALRKTFWRALQSVHADAHTHCASRRDIHEKAWNINHHTHDAYACELFKTDAIRPPSLSCTIISPLDGTDGGLPFSTLIYVSPKIMLQDHKRKSGVDLCCRAFFLSSWQSRRSSAMFHTQTYGQVRERCGTAFFY